MFEEIGKAVRECFAVCTAELERHKRNLEQIENDFAASRAQEERNKENQRHARVLEKIKPPYLARVQQVHDTLKAFIDGKMANVSENTLKELHSLMYSNLPLTDYELQILAGRYAGDYYAQRYLSKLAAQNNSKLFPDFDLSRNLEVLENAYSEAMAAIQNAGQATDDVAVNVALTRLTAEGYFENTYNSAFYDNPITRGMQSEEIGRMIAAIHGAKNHNERMKLAEEYKQGYRRALIDSIQGDTKVDEFREYYLRGKLSEPYSGPKVIVTERDKAQFS